MSQSFPPPDFVPAPSAVTGIEIYMPAPEHVGDARETVHFTCPQCGGSTAFSATNGGLTCTNCNYYEPPKQTAAGRTAEEFKFTVEALARSARGWGAKRAELQCQSCGAYTSLPPDALTHTCPFCGSNNVIQRQSAQDAPRPRFLIPFKFEADPCAALTRDWLGSSRMTYPATRRYACPIAQAATPGRTRCPVCKTLPPVNVAGPPPPTIGESFVGNHNLAAKTGRCC